MVRHVLAPIVPAAARSLELARTLPAEITTAGSARVAAITFDDGPHPEGTPQMLKILAQAGECATFFVIGEQVERRPELVRRMLADGHAVALHGYRHRLQLRIRRSELDADIRRGVAAIEDATGTTPRHHRAPFGIYSASGLRIVREQGLTPLLWSAWGRDWRAHTTPRRIAARVRRGMVPGGVILLHDADFYSAERSHERTALALPVILRELKSREIGTVLVV